MIYDTNFLKELSEQQNKIFYGKIIALDSKEREIEEISGIITKGTVNVDSKSIIRRTCNLSLISQTMNITEYLWTLNHKFKLLIGLENNFDKRYDSIIWLPQGIFVITTFSSSMTTSSNTFSISGKDKMCLLNGEVGGTFSSEIDFGQIEIEDNGTITNLKLPIKKIIREMIHQYGNEPFYNIVINDLDDTGLELLEYRLEQPLYIWKEIGSQEFTNGTLNDKTEVYLAEDNSLIYIKDIPIFEPLLSIPGVDIIPTQFYFPKDENKDKGENKYYTAAKIEYGDTAGYKETELIYPDKLIAKQGQTITSILDKIKKMLVFYEYFYNIEGQFVFQKKKNKNNIFELTNPTLLTSLDISPNLKNVKNDFTVWGNRKTTNGVEIPIHMRWGIQKKPVQYNTIEVNNEELKNYNKTYGLKTKGQKSILYSIQDYDWREIIYQMALDYHKYNHLDNFELKIAKANPDYYPTGKTGYEQYYVDLQGFWRQLYNPNELLNLNPKNLEYSSPWIYSTDDGQNAGKIQKYVELIYDEEKKETIFHIKEHPAEDKIILKQMLPNISIGSKCLIECEIQSTSKSSIISFSTQREKKDINLQELPNSQENSKWKKFSFSFEGLRINNIKDFICFESQSDISIKNCRVFNKDFSLDKKSLYWNKDFFNHPENQNFYFDLLDKGSLVERFSTTLIGDRPKVNNNKSVKAIFYRETPQIIFGKPLKELKTGYRYFNIPNFENTFSSSFQGKSAEDELKILLNDSSECLESISLKTIPLYYLQPNDKIYINDLSSGTNGIYNINRYSLSLNYDSIMSITATKDLEEIF